MAWPRRLAQPGPADPVRIESFEGRGRTLDLALEPGQSLNDAIARPLLEAGIEGAALTLDGGSFHPFTYLMPALSPDGEHAAWYSAPISTAGETRIETANVTFGRRDGELFIHCHGLWIEADGQRRGGHPLPARHGRARGDLPTSASGPIPIPRPRSRSFIRWRWITRPPRAGARA